MQRSQPPFRADMVGMSHLDVAHDTSLGDLCRFLHPGARLLVTQGGQGGLLVTTGDEGPDPPDLGDEAHHQLVDLLAGQMLTVIAQAACQGLHAVQRGTQLVIALGDTIAARHGVLAVENGTRLHGRYTPSPRGCPRWPRCEA